MLKKGDVTLVHVTRQYDDVMYTVDVESGEKEKKCLHLLHLIDLERLSGTDHPSCFVECSLIFARH